VTDHWHHASEIQGAADDRHGHPGLERDISNVESDLRNHRHHDDERAVDELRRELRELRQALTEYERDLADARSRIRDLEAQTPEARQLELEADIAAADLAGSGYDPGPEVDDEGRVPRLWRLRRLPLEDCEGGQP
jgi:hypothetical protein